MFMLRYFFVFGMIFFLNGCKKEQVPSHWASSPPTIDGTIEEWQNVPLMIFSEKAITVGVQNDSVFLYLGGRMAEAALQRAVRRPGMTLWLDPEGGKSKELELHFPASGYADFNETRGGFWNSMTEDQRERARNQLEKTRNSVLVINKKTNNSRVFPPGTPDGFDAAVSELKGLFSFEVRIPLQIQNYFPECHALGSQGKVGIGIRLGGFRGDKRFRSGDWESEEPIGPMPAPGRGGIDRGMPTQQQPSMEESEIWLEVTLVNEPEAIVTK